jgi:hypothetical protein
VTRPSAAALALAALVCGAFVVRPLAHGVATATLASFWAVTLGQVVVPGVLLARGTRLVAGDGWLLLGQGATLGLALQGLAVMAGRALSAPWLPTLVAILAASAGVFLLRRAAAPGARGASAPGWLPLAVMLPALLLQPLASAQRFGVPLPFDLLFHAGNAAELRHRWPLEDPRVAGIPLYYHLLAYALPVEAADLARAPLADTLFALAPLVWVALLALQAVNAGRVVFGSAPAGALAALLLLLHGDPGHLLGLGPGAFNSDLASGIYGSPTTICGLLMLAGIVITLDGWLAGARGASLAALFVLALAASAAKTTVLPVVLAGLAAAGALAALRRRGSELARLALAGGVIAAAGAPLTLWQRGGDEGYTGIVGLGAATVFSKSPFAEALARAAGSDTLPAALVAPGFVLWLVGYLGLAGVAAALWLAGHCRRLGTLQVVCLGAVGAGLALGLALDVPGMSQLFLVYNGQLLLALFAGAYLHELRARAWSPPLALAATGLLLLLSLPCLEKLALGMPATMREDTAAAAHVRSPLERDYATGLAWLRAHASRGAVVFADNPSLLLSAIGEVRLYYENGLYTARAWQVGHAREPWPERVAIQERLLRRPDAAALIEARRAIGPGQRLVVAADFVQSRIEAGFVHAVPGPVPARRLFPVDLFERPYASATLQVYEALEPER